MKNVSFLVKVKEYNEYRVTILSDHPSQSLTVPINGQNTIMTLVPNSGGAARGTTVQSAVPTAKGTTTTTTTSSGSSQQGGNSTVL